MLKTKKKISYKLQDSYTFQGLPISVENKAGSIRRSEPGQTPRWETKMGYDYGYIRNTEAKDKEAVDVYVNRKSKGKTVPYHDVSGGELVDQPVFVIHQKQIQKTSKWHNGICPDCKKHHTECKHAYDEDKVMLGFDNKDEAVKAYLGQYDSPRFLGPVSTYTLTEFKKDLKNSWGKKLPYKNGKHEHWYGVDLDGTLAKDDGWKGIEHIGEPIQKTRERIEKRLKEGKKVKILTARASDKKAIPYIKEWLKLNNLPLLEITNKKDPGMISLEDDRVVRVQRNTGNLIKSVSAIYYLDWDKMEKSFIRATTVKTKSGKIVTRRAHTDIRRKKVIVKKPHKEKPVYTGPITEGIKGPNGNTLIAYQWMSMEGEKWNEYEGGLVGAKVSDWEQAVECETCGKKIVHAYWVKDKKTGETAPYGRDHLHEALGYRREITNANTKKFILELKAQEEQKEAWKKDYLGKTSQTWRDSLRDFSRRNSNVSINDFPIDFYHSEKHEKFLVLPKGVDGPQLDALTEEGFKVITQAEGMKLDKMGKNLSTSGIKLDKSYLGQSGDSFGSTTMLKENIKNSKAIIINRNAPYINPADKGYTEEYLLKYRNKIYVPKVSGPIAKGCIKKMMIDEQIKSSGPIKISTLKEAAKRHPENVRFITEGELRDRVDEDYQKNKFPNETKHEYIERTKKEIIAKQNQMITGYMQKAIIIPRDEFQKGFVKQHTRKGKVIASYYTKRKKKVGEVKHKTMHRLDMTPKEAAAKIALIEKAKKVHDEHIKLAKDHKEGAEKSKSDGKQHYEKHGRKYLVNEAIAHLDDHIKHHENKKQSHDNHIKKIEGRWDTEHEYWAKKKEEKKAKKGEKKDGLTFDSQEEYMDWYRKQPQNVKDNHKLNRTDGKLIVSLDGKEEVKKPVEKKPLPKKAVVIKKEEKPKESVSKLPSGWAESSPGGIMTSKDQVRGGIIDNEIVSGKWFAIPHDDNASKVEGFNTREEAYKALMNELDRVQKPSKKVVVPKEKEISKPEPKKTEAEKSKSRSEAMMGNKNAEKDGKAEEAKKVIVKKPEEEKKPVSKKAVVIPREKIVDFGQKIGGARKDMFVSGLKGKDILDFSERELVKHVTKDKVWPKPNYEKLIDAGLNPNVAYLIKRFRDSLPAKMNLSSREEPKIKEYAKKYIELIEKSRDVMSKVESLDDFKDLFSKIFSDEHEKGVGWKVNSREPSKVAFYTRKLRSGLHISNWDLAKAKKEVDKGWGLSEPHLKDIKIGKVPTVTSDDQLLIRYKAIGDGTSSPEFETEKEADDWAKLRYEALKDHNISFGTVSQKNRETGEWDKKKGWYASKGSLIVTPIMNTRKEVEDRMMIQHKLKPETGKGKRKPKFTRPQLRGIQRTGTDHRKGESTNTKDFQSTFGFKGGEFGNWNTQADRQQSMDHASDAMNDLADIIGVDPKEMSFDGDLSIAFGARGAGLSGASAHYEPAKKVINLTKMSGAGSLAHEWAHGFDDYIRKVSGTQTLKSPYATDSLTNYNSDLPEKTVDAFKEIIDKMKYQKVSLEEHRAGKTSSMKTASKGLKTTLDQLRESMVRDKFPESSLKIFDKEIVPDIMKGPDKDEKHIPDGKKQYAVIPEKLHNLTNVFYKDRKGRNESYYKNNLKYYYNRLGSAKRELDKGSEVNLPNTSSNYMKGAQQMAQFFGKKDYWPSTVEMFGRAFESYIHDKIKGKGNKSDYLVHSTSNAGYEMYADPDTGEVPKPFPEGKEREEINKSIDKFIKLFKKGNQFQKSSLKTEKAS